MCTVSAAVGVPAATAAPAAGRRARRAGVLGLLRATGAGGIISAVVIAVATVLAIIGPWVAPYNPDLPNLSLAWVGPVGGHLLGFDFEGRDVLSRLLAGAQSSMIGPLAVVVGAMVLGTLIAVVSAWRQGLTDTVASSGLDILFAFPGILLAVLAAAVFGAARRPPPSRSPSRTCRTWPECCVALLCGNVGSPTPPPSRCRGSAAPRSACGTSCRTCCR